MKRFYIPQIIVAALLSLLPLASNALPFVPVSNPNTKPIHWYYLKVNNSKYVYASPDPEGMADADISVSSTTSNTDEYLWCFVGTTSSGYKIYNRASKTYLYAGGFLGDASDPTVDYYEAGSGNNFYIYFKFTPFGSSQVFKNYLCYSNSDGFYTTMGKDSYFTVTEAYYEEDKQPTAPPTINVEMGDEYCTIKVSGAGEVHLYINGIDKENPCNIARTDEDQYINIVATAQESGKEMSTTTQDIVIPKLENTEPDPTTITLTPYAYNIAHNELDNNGDEGYRKLFDKSRNTKWCVVNSSGSWQTIWVDFKSEKPFVPDSYTLTPGNDTYSYSNRNPKTWKVYGKAKEQDEWTTLSSMPSGDNSVLGTDNKVDYKFSIESKGKSYQYFRFEVIEICGTDRWGGNHTFQMSEFQFQAKQNDIINGDVNGDDRVDVEDVNALINIILKTKTESDYSGNADVNGDNKVDVEDVNAVINIILK